MFHHGARRSLTTSRWDDLDEAVRHVVTEHGSGSLIVHGDHESGTIYFEGGLITFASSRQEHRQEPLDPTWRDAPEDATTRPESTSRVGAIVGQVILNLRSNESATIEFQDEPSPYRGTATFPAEEWFDLSEPAAFAIYPLTRIA